MQLFPLIFSLIISLILSLMTAFLSYNGFNHATGQVGVQFHFYAVLNEGEQIVAYKARADITGMLIAQNGDPADLTAQIEAIQTAYVNGGDLILMLDAGTQSANSIINALTIGGTRVVRAPSFPDGGGTEYVTKRNFVAAIEAEIPTLDGNTALWAFEERLTFQGTGGPATDVIECAQGDPEPQTTKQRTAMTATQEGRATGYLGYWAQMYATPIWPSIEQQQFRIQSPGSPRRTGSGSNMAYKMFPTFWRYQFKSADPLSSLTPPTFWPALGAIS